MKTKNLFAALFVCLIIGAIMMACGCTSNPTIKPTIKHEVSTMTYDRVIGYKLVEETQFFSYSSGGHIWVTDTVKKPITVTAHGYYIESSCVETATVLSMTGTFSEVDSAKCAHERILTGRYDSLMMLINKECK